VIQLMRYNAHFAPFCIGASIRIDSTDSTDTSKILGFALMLYCHICD